MTQVDQRLEFGLLIPHFTQHASREAIIEGTRVAESLGFDSVWVRDHLFISSDHTEHGGITDPGFITEATLTLAALSTVTDRVKLGTAVITPHRNPVKVAQLFATLDYLSAGRAILGIGAGWDINEFNAAGMPFESRVQMVRETVAICRQAWSHPEFEYHGEVFQIPRANINPRPAGGDMPVWYGGLSFKAVELAVEFGDGWIPSRIPFDRLRDRIEHGRKLLSDQGRITPFTFAAMPQTALGPSAAEAISRFNIEKVKAEALHRKPVSGGRKNLTLEDLEGYLIWGNATDICRYVERFISLGVRHIVFDMRSSFGQYRENMRLLGEQVLPRFR